MAAELGDRAKNLLGLLKLEVEGGELQSTVAPEINLGGDLAKNIIDILKTENVETDLDWLLPQLKLEDLGNADDVLHKAVDGILKDEPFYLGARENQKDTVRDEVVNLLLNLSALQIKIILMKVVHDCEPCRPKERSLEVLIALLKAINQKVKALDDLREQKLIHLKAMATGKVEQARAWGEGAAGMEGGGSNMYKLKYLKYKAKYMGLRSRRRY